MIGQSQLNFTEDSGGGGARAKIIKGSGARMGRGRLVKSSGGEGGRQAGEKIRARGSGAADAPHFSEF